MSSIPAVLFDPPEYLDALVLDHSEHLLGLFGRDGRVVRANHRLLSVGGIPEPELWGRVLWSSSWSRHLGVCADELHRAFEAALSGRESRLSNPPAADDAAISLTFRAVTAQTSLPIYVMLEGQIDKALPREVDTLLPVPAAAVQTYPVGDASVARHACREDESEFSIAGTAAPAVSENDLNLSAVEIEAQFGAFFNAAPVGFFILDASLRYRIVNEALASVYGVPVEAHHGRTVGEICPLFAPAVERAHRQISEGKRAVRKFEVIGKISSRAGETRCWSISCFPVSLGAGQAPGLGGLVQDVTDARKLRDAGSQSSSATALDVTEAPGRASHTDTLSRLCAALSATADALVHCGTPDEIYRAVCRALVDEGGFRMAWVGVADETSAYILASGVATSGAAPQVPLAIDIRDDESDSDPTACAHRRQRLCTLRASDDGFDDLVLRLREAGLLEAERLGFALATPLMRGGAPFATLTAYADEADTFGHDAERLLEDIAARASLALDLLDREALRSKTESALRASESRLLQAQAISKMGDWELERDTGKMTWSQQLFPLFERRIEDGPPDLRETFGYYTADSLDRTRRCFRQVVETGQAGEIEQTVALPSGRTRYHTTVVVPVVSETGHIERLYGTVHDITDRKLAERELLRRTSEVEDLYQNAPCGYHSIDAEGRIIRINNTELRWLGYALDEVFGRMTAFDLFSPECHRVFKEDFERLKETGESRVLELELLRKDGSRLPVVASSTAIFSDDGKFVAARTTLADDSQRKQLECERAAYVARLAEMSRHLVDVQESERRQLASALHDNASPNLAALRITFSRLASALPADVLQEVQPMLDDAHALLHDTTTGIRAICTDLRPATLDYAGIIAALREYASHFSRRTGIEVAIEHVAFTATLLPNVQSLLFRIAQEALTNASKHAQATKIDIRLAGSDGDVTLEISDDGVGFDPGSLGKTRSSPGLGLITMKERAEFAGGTFSIRSDTGRGTSILVVFDRSARMRGRRASDAPNSPATVGQAAHGNDQQH